MCTIIHESLETKEPGHIIGLFDSRFVLCVATSIDIAFLDATYRIAVPQHPRLVCRVGLVRLAFSHRFVFGPAGLTTIFLDSSLRSVFAVLCAPASDISLSSDRLHSGISSGLC